MEKDNEVGLPELRTLLDRFLARHNPITSTALQRFLERPEGPQGHPDLVAAKRLADDVRLIHTTPDGEVVLFSHKTSTVIWESGRTFTLPTPREGREGDGIYGAVVGIRSDGAVVSRTHIHDSMDGSDHSYDLFINDQKVSDSSWRATLLPDDSLLWTTDRQVQRLYPDGTRHTHELRDRETREFFLADSQLLALITKHEARGWRYTLTDVVQGNEPYRMDTSILSVLSSGSDVYLLTYVDGWYKVVCVDQDGCETEERIVTAKHDPGDPQPYKTGDLCQLTDGRLALKLPTWGHEQWCFGGVRHPKFTQVSRIFQKDGRDYYYGQVGRHLFTMEIPLP